MEQLDQDSPQKERKVRHINNDFVEAMDEPIHSSAYDGFTGHSVLIEVAAELKSEIEGFLAFFHGNLE